MISLHDKLAAGAPDTPLLGICAMYPSPGALERIAPDWDFVWIDAQHGQLGYTEILTLVRACDLVGKPALVRTAWHETGEIAKALDTNCAGVIVPCVDTVEEAKAIIQAGKFPPLGRRSYGGRRPVDLDGRNFADKANERVMLILMIESPRGIDNADAIAALPGVDGLFLGPDDVMLYRGYTMTTPRSADTLGADMKRVADACKKHGKIVMNVGLGEEMLKINLDLGCRLIIAGGDVPFLANTSKSTAAQSRQIVAAKAPAREKSAANHA